MGIQVADGFSLKSKKPLDERLQFATVALMVATSENNLYDGCEAYVIATKKYYSYDSTNEVDETLGKWRERQSGGGETTDYSGLDNKPQIEGVTLIGNKLASDLGLAKLTDLTDFITKTVDDLVNYYTKSQTYSKTEVDTIVTAIKNSRFEVVATLPTSDIKTNVIYLVPKADAESGDIKDEYINLDGTTAGWEKIGSTEVDLSGYVTSDDLNTALEDYTTTTDLTALLANKQDKLQYSTLPTASAELEGKIFEYTGATGGGLTHGYFYECVSDGEDSATYSWQQTDVQPSGGGGTDYTAGDGIDITDDTISIDPMPAEDMDEIVKPLPSTRARYHRYSTEEQIVGTWIDGRNIYEKTFNFGALPNSTSKELAHGLSIDRVISLTGVAAASNGGTLTLPDVRINVSDVEYIRLFISSVGNISIVCNTDKSSLTAYITIQYIKTA